MKPKNVYCGRIDIPLDYKIDLNIKKDSLWRKIKKFILCLDEYQTSLLDLVLHILQTTIYFLRMSSCLSEKCHAITLMLLLRVSDAWEALFVNLWIDSFEGMPLAL